MKRTDTRSMLCPNCGGRNTVIDTRTGVEANTVKRIRECNTCRLRFYTVEKIVPMEVRYKDV